MFFRRTAYTIFIILFFNSCSSGTQDETVLPSQDNKNSQVDHSYHPAIKETADTTTTAKPATEETADTTTTAKPATEETADRVPLFQINYEKQSIGAIDLSITKEKANEILTLSSEERENLYVYEDGISIRWSEQGQADEIFLSQKLFTFNNTHLDIPQFIRFRDLTLELRDFFSTLYKITEQEDIDCIAEKKCFIASDPNYPDIAMFLLPKMKLLYTLNLEHKTLKIITISIERDNQTYKNVIKQFQAESITEDNSSTEQNLENSSSESQAQSEQEISTPRLISYKNRSVGEFNSNTTKELANQALTLKSEEGNEDGHISVYEEGFIFEWNEEGKLANLAVTANIGFAFDDPSKKAPKIGYSIKFNNIDADAMLFFTTLYNMFEDTRINCFQEEKCSINKVQNIPDKFAFVLPKMKLWFSEPKGNYITLNTITFTFIKSKPSIEELSLQPEPSTEELSLKPDNSKESEE